MNPELTNYSFNTTLTKGTEITYSYTGISSEGIIIIFFGVAIIATYIIFSRNPEKYSKWVNKKGHEVNLVRLMRIILYSYTALIVAGFLIQKFFFGG